MYVSTGPRRNQPAGQQHAWNLSKPLMCSITSTFSRRTSTKCFAISAKGSALELDRDAPCAVALPPADPNSSSF